MVVHACNTSAFGRLWLRIPQVQDHSGLQGDTRSHKQNKKTKEAWQSPDTSSFSPGLLDPVGVQRSTRFI